MIFYIEYFPFHIIRLLKIFSNIFYINYIYKLRFYTPIE